MPSTYTVNLGIEKPATGEQSGTWGDTVNDNSNILDEAINGVVSITLASAGSSGSPNSITITNGALSTGRNKWIEFTDGGDLGAAAYVQLTPNDAEKICFIRNSLTASRSIFLFQGTYNASNDLEIAAGTDVVVKFNGGGTGATVVNVYANLKVDGIVATTADINGGTVDGTVIGGAAAAALTATTVVANTSLNIAGTTTISSVLDEDNMASDSATALATQQSIKAYVDSQVGTVDTLSEILANGNTTGATDIDVDGAQKVQFRDAAIYINSSVDGQLDIVADTEIQIAATTIDINGAIVASGDISAASLDISGNVDIDGITNLDVVDIDGAVQIDAALTVGVDDTGYDVKFFGATGGKYMLWNQATDTLDVVGSIEFDSLSGTGAVAITDIKDEDNMASDSATALATQQSIKAYVDAQVGSFDTLAEVLANGNTTGANDIAFTDSAKITATGDMTLDAVGNIILDADSGEIEFKDGGTTFGNIAKSGNDLRINQSIQDGDIVFRGNDGGSIITALTLDLSEAGAATFNSSITIPDYIYHTSDDNTYFGFPGGDEFELITAAQSRIKLVGSGTTFNEGGNDKDFRVESAVASDSFFVDGASGYVGINDISPSAQLDLNTSSGLMTILNSSHVNGGYVRFEKSGVVYGDLGNGAQIVSGGATTAFGMNTRGTGDLLLATNGVTRASLQNGGAFTTTPAAGGHAVFNEGGVDADFRVESDGNPNMLFVDGGNNRVGVGVEAPEAVLHIEARANGSGIGFYVDTNTRAGGETYFYLGRDVAPNLTIDTSENITFNGSTVFNEASADVDFRVESDTNTHALFVDAGNNVIGTGTSSPATYVGTGGLAVKGSTVSDLSLVSGGIASGNNSHQMRYWNDTGTAYEIARTRVNVGAGQVNRGEYQFSVNNGGGLRQWLDVDYQGNVRFNEGGNDSDFRVESDTNANALLVDASLSHVGINRAASSVVALSINSTATDSSTYALEACNSSNATKFHVRSDGHSVFYKTGNAFGFVHNTDGGITTTPDVGGHAVFNEAGVDADFRVESDANTHTLFVDAEYSRVSINTTFINSGTLQVQANANAQAITAKTATDGYSLFQGFNSSDGLVFQVTGSGSLTSNTASVFNENGDDFDFRVESDGNENMLFVDAGNNRVGVGTGSATSPLHVQGTSNDTIDETMGTAKFEASGGNGLIVGTIASAPYSTYLQSGYIVDTSLAQYPLSLQPLGGGVIVNESGVDADFRVESDTSSHAFFMDGTNGKVVLGGSETNAELYVTKITAGEVVRADNSQNDWAGVMYYSVIFGTGNNNGSVSLDRHFSGYAGGAVRFVVCGNGDVKNTNNSYGAISDLKLKENIVDSGSQWDDIKALRIRKYSMKDEHSV
jgi:hypothetical protein